MKRVLVSLITIAVACTIGQSQIKLGVRAGLSSASYSASDFTSTDYIVKKSSDASFGYHFGLFGQVKLLGFFVQPELLLTSIGNNYELKNVAANTSKSVSDRTYNLDIPIIFGYKFGPAKLEAGPVARINLANTTNYSDYKYNFNTASWAFQLGAGLQISRISVDLKYEFGLSKLGSGVSVGGVERKFEPRVSQFVLSVGYFFF